MLTKKINKSILLGTLLASTTAYAQTNDLQQQVEALKKEVQALKSQTQNNKELISSSLNSSQDNKISFHGFMSLGASQLSESGLDIEYSTGQGSDPSVKPNTWVGLQMNANLYKGGEFVFQVVSKGVDDFEPETEWLYLKQDLGHGFNAQIGRIRFPAFIDSEVVYIGNTYATVKPATEIYSVLPISHLDGVSVNHSTDVGEWTIDSKVVIWGESEEATSGYTLELEEVHGAVFSFSRDFLTMRIGAFAGKEIIDINYAPDNLFPAGVRERFGDDLTYTTAAVRFDNSEFYFSTEGIDIKSDNDLLDENTNWNVTTGVYFGSVLVYIGASETKVKNGDDLQAAITSALSPVTVGGVGFPVPAGNVFRPWLERKQETRMVGMKWDFNPRATFKVQIQHVDDFDGSFGNFNNSPNDEDMYIYDIAIQSTF